MIKYNRKGQLHLHTNFSDGLIKPQDIIDAGLSFVAITDHDTMDAVNIYQRKLSNTDTRVIPGVELSATYYGKDLHMLLYQPNLSEDFVGRMNDMTNNRRSRAKEIISKVKEYGFTFDDKFLEKRSSSLTRGNITDEIFSYSSNILRLTKEGLTNEQDFIAEYLNNGKKLYSELVRLELKDYLNGVEGIKVLAHPGEDFKMGIEDNIIKNLVEDFGIKGIEVTYRKHTDEQVKHYDTLADRLGLIKITSGDCHKKGHLYKCQENIDTLNRLLN